MEDCRPRTCRLGVVQESWNLCTIEKLHPMLNNKNANLIVVDGELLPQPHINNIGLCVHYMIYRIKLVNNNVI